MQVVAGAVVAVERQEVAETACMVVAAGSRCSAGRKYRRVQWHATRTQCRHAGVGGMRNAGHGGEEKGMATQLLRAGAAAVRVVQNRVQEPNAEPQNCVRRNVVVQAARRKSACVAALVCRRWQACVNPVESACLVAVQLRARRKTVQVVAGARQNHRAAGAGRRRAHGGVAQNARVVHRQKT